MPIPRFLVAELREHIAGKERAASHRRKPRHRQRRGRQSRAADARPFERCDDEDVYGHLFRADLVDLAAYKAKGKTAGQTAISDGAPARFELALPPPEGGTGLYDGC